MDKKQRDVTDFQMATGQKVVFTPTRLDPETLELRLNLVREEAEELLEAIEANDLVAIAKEACDLLYVVNGTATSCGIDLDEPWDIVHRSNMLKIEGKIRADGKRLKPEGWVPVEDQIERALGL